MVKSWSVDNGKDMGSFVVLMVRGWPVVNGT